MTTLQYTTKLNEYRGQLNSASRLYKQETLLNQRLAIDYIDSELALDILTLVGKQTQEQLSFRIENLVTGALEYVFENPYQFKVEIDIKRNATQCELYFERDGFKADPMGDSGGSVLDIASIALRLSMWSLQTSRSSPVFILDECNKHVSVDLRERASMFLKEMCARLNIQIIAVSHDETIIDASDRVTRIFKDGEFSMAEMVKQ